MDEAQYRKRKLTDEHGRNESGEIVVFVAVGSICILQNAYLPEGSLPLIPLMWG